MPIANSRGQTIQELDETDYDFVSHVHLLRKLEWPKDGEILRHLTEEDFKLWVYGLEPKFALFLTNEKKFRMIQERQACKKWFLVLYDWCWRQWHGLDY